MTPVQLNWGFTRKKEEGVEFRVILERVFILDPCIWMQMNWASGMLMLQVAHLSLEASSQWDSLPREKGPNSDSDSHSDRGAAKTPPWQPNSPTNSNNNNN